MNYVEIDGKEYLPLPEYGELMGLTSKTVNHYAWSGKVETIKVGHYRYVPKDVVEANLKKSTYKPIRTVDTFRRDLIAQIYVAMVVSSEQEYKDKGEALLAECAISIADTLIKAMEGGSEHGN
jgi:hypothetical protein